jgi:hypothetical protein
VFKEKKAIARLYSCILVAEDMLISSNKIMSMVIAIMELPFG